MKKVNSFTIYNASAGSGKTFTLVKEYLLLLFTAEKSDAYKNILAITFTNKAVAEMKSRIIDNLYAFSNEECPEKQQSLLRIISEETGFSSEEIRTKAQQILKSIIHNYAAFEVSTIDGFTHRVLRTFAKDLDVPLNFEVELNTQEVLQEAVDRLISKAGEDKQLTKVLVDFAISKADDDKSWDIARDLFEISKLLTNETNHPFFLLLKDKNLQDFENLSINLKKYTQLLEGKIVETGNQFFDLLEQNGLENTDFTGKYCPNFFKKLQNKNFEVKFDANWQLNLAENNLYPNRVNDAQKLIMDQLQPEIVSIFNRAKENIIQLQLLQAVQKNLTPLSLLSSIQDEIEAIKEENGIVLISEFNATIGKAVKDQPAPFIYERLGERYNHYFIDEFQDTSQMQWENLVPLIDHTLITDHPKNEHGSLTLVGDAKQSIYRWRGGKAEQFMDLCQNENPFGIEKNLILLPNNYRSAKEIIEFNNDFFKFSAGVFANKEHQVLFEETNSQNPIKPKGGYVNLSFIEAENAEEEMEMYPERVLEIIRDLEAKNISKDNICILTRRKKESVAIANFLSENNIPLISSESLLISNSQKVQFIISMLQFAEDGKDKNTKLQIFDFLLKHRIETENEHQFISERIELEQQPFFNSLKDFGIDFNIKPITEISIYEAVETIIRSFNLVEGSNAYVQFFLDFVYEFSQKENAGISKFLEIWEQKKEKLSITAPEGENAVQIMTIHKAKGLEFPVVIYPFANTLIKDVARESLWMPLPEPLNNEIPVGLLKASSKMEEWGEDASGLYHELCCNSQLDALNVLYVALTRPVQQLYLISKMELDKKGNENTNKFSGLFISYLKALEKWDGRQEYEFGNKNGFVSEEKTGFTSIQPEKFYSSPTQGQGISIITKSGLLWNSKQESAIEKGQLVHELFAAIHTAKDLDMVLENAKNEGLFKAEEENEIKSTFLEVLNHPELKEYYSGASINYNEKDMISETGMVLRPDRINILGKQVNILDYKTGEAKPQHQNQINAYAEVLSGMGYKVDKKILVYLNEEVSVSIV